MKWKVHRKHIVTISAYKSLKILQHAPISLKSEPFLQFLKIFFLFRLKGKGVWKLRAY